MGLSTKALARLREAGVVVDSVALASAETKASARMPSPSVLPTPTDSPVLEAKAAEEEVEFDGLSTGNPGSEHLSGETHMTAKGFSEFIVRVLTAHGDKSAEITDHLYSVYLHDAKFRSLLNAATFALGFDPENADPQLGEDEFHSMASASSPDYEAVALFATVAASSRVQQSLATASSCKGSAVESMAYRFAATEAIAAYNKTPDHEVKIPVGRESIAAVANILSGVAVAASMSSWPNIKAAAKAEGVTLKDSDQVLIEAALTKIRSAKANNSGIDIGGMVRRMKGDSFKAAKTFSQQVDALCYG